MKKIFLKKFEKNFLKKIFKKIPRKISEKSLKTLRFLKILSGPNQMWFWPNVRDEAERKRENQFVGSFEIKFQRILNKKTT